MESLSRIQKTLKETAVVVIVLILLVETGIPLIHLTIASDDRWFDVNWQYRKSITINSDAVSEIEENFTFVIDTVDDDLVLHARSDGFDVVFVDGVTGSALCYEIESYDNSTGHLVAWVMVPSLSPVVPTVIYMYYGNPDASDQQSPGVAWDSSYMMVLHLDEESGLLLDSTTNGNNGQPYGVSQGVAGRIDGGDSFDGVNDYVEVSHSETITGFSSGFTVSFWMKLNSVTRWQTILSKYMTGAGTNKAWYVDYRPDTKTLNFFLSQDGINYCQYYASFSPQAGQWYYVSVVWVSGQVPMFYVNGQRVSTRGFTGTVTSIYSNAGVSLLIGKCGYDGTRYLNGVLDEVQISNVALSSNWILTTYMTQTHPCMVGGEESN